MTQDPAAASSLLGRMFILLRRPVAGWRLIAQRPHRFVRLLGLAAIVGSIGPLSRAAALMVFGQSVQGVVYRPGVTAAMMEAAISDGLILGLSLGFAVLISLWSRAFKGSADGQTSLKVAIYSSAPGWISSCLFLFPGFGGWAVFGSLYGVYIFYRGAELLIRPARLPIYVAVVLVSYVALALAITQGLRWVIAGV